MFDDALYPLFIIFLGCLLFCFCFMFEKLSLRVFDVNYLMPGIELCVLKKRWFDVMFVCAREVWGMMEGLKVSCD